MASNDNYKGSTELGDTNIHGKFNLSSNLIIINDSNTYDQVSNNVSGIKINRGTSSPYNILFDEQDRVLKIGLGDNLKEVLTKDYVQDSNPIINIEQKDSIIIITRLDGTTTSIEIAAKQEFATTLDIDELFI